MTLPLAGMLPMPLKKKLLKKKFLSKKGLKKDSRGIRKNPLKKEKIPYLGMIPLLKPVQREATKILVLLLQAVKAFLGLLTIPRAISLVH